MNRFLDVVSLVQIPIGFLIGLVILLTLELFGLGFWAQAGMLILAVPLYFIWTYVMDRPWSLDPMHWFLSKELRKKNKRLDARDRKIGRVAFPLGIVLAFMAAQIWPPLEISKALF